MGKKIKLSYVNEGKEFELPKLTVTEQQKWLDDMARLEKDIKKKDKDGFDKEKFDRDAGKLFLLHMLKLVDGKVTLDNINNMHPSDYIYISNLIWRDGREIESEKQDFQ